MKHTSSDQQVGFARINDQESGGRGKKPISDAEIKKQKGGQEFLDSFGTEEFLKIIQYVIKDANIFVISHKEGMQDKFTSVIKFEKRNGFSYKVQLS